MDAGAIMEYFHPLMEWLKKQNTEETAGWSELSFLLLITPIDICYVFGTNLFSITGGMNSGIAIKITWVAAVLPFVLTFVRLW